MVSLTAHNPTAAPVSGPRPVNLRTDLAQLADLIELAFSDSMDSGGRAAVRELRALSRMGPGLNVLAGVNDLTQGISLGYVWEIDGKVVGNVSVYPANWPAGLGNAWIIANVAVHPAYRGRGIARHLMEASLDMIRRRGGTTAILQVDRDNGVARHLYERLGLVAERTWVQWRRSPTGRLLPPAPGASVYITRRRPGDWRAEAALAERVRPAHMGGLGWLRPLNAGLFRKSLFAALSDWISLRSLERLAVYSEDGGRIDAAMWIESAFAAGSVQLTLMVAPEYQGLYDDALISLAVRRFGARQPLTIEHPEDELATGGLLRQYGFRPARALVHMRWDVTG